MRTRALARRAMGSALGAAVVLAVVVVAGSGGPVPARAVEAGTGAVAGGGGEAADPVSLRNAMGPPAGAPLQGDALERRTREVASLIRCPVCQGSSVADSPATMAQNMKSEVRELLAAGYDEEQIIHYFELAYGEFIRMKPKAEGLNALLWVGPGLALVGGLGGIGIALRRRRGLAAAVATSSPSDAVQPRAAVVGDDDARPVPGRGELPADPTLARYVRRVRAIAYGWPNGEPPPAAKRA